MAGRRLHKNGDPLDEEPRWRELLLAHPGLIDLPRIQDAMARDRVRLRTVTVRDHRGRAVVRIDRRGGARAYPERSARDALLAAWGCESPMYAYERWSRFLDAVYERGAQILDPADSTPPMIESLAEEYGRSNCERELIRDTYVELGVAVQSLPCSFIVCSKVPPCTEPHLIELRRGYVIDLPPDHPAAVDDDAGDSARLRVRWELMSEVPERAMTPDAIRWRIWNWNRRLHWRRLPRTDAA